MKRNQIIRIAKRIVNRLANREEVYLFNGYFNQCQLGDTLWDRCNPNEKGRILEELSQRIKDGIKDKLQMPKS